MDASPSLLLDLPMLTHYLRCALRTSGSVDDGVLIICREPNIYTSTSSSEIVTCRSRDGSDLRVFCKYGGREIHDSYGHRGGLPYEAEVYRHALQPLPLSLPRFYGAHTDPTTGTTLLALEYVHGAERLALTAAAEAALGLAARWIGCFHAANEKRLSQPSMTWFNMYDRAYYLAWARRTSLFAGELHREFPWLASLCDRFEEFVPALLASPLTLIHGEYTMSNLLIRNGAIYPTDWESAAVGPGEIDLAMLIDGWPEEDAQRAEVEYQRTRWPEGAPEAFRHRLDVARMYIQLRWLGDRPETTLDKRFRWRFETLRRDEELLGASR